MRLASLPLSLDLSLALKYWLAVQLTQLSQASAAHSLTRSGTDIKANSSYRCATLDMHGAARSVLATACHKNASYLNLPQHQRGARHRFQLSLPAVPVTSLNSNAPLPHMCVCVCVCLCVCADCHEIVTQFTVDNVSAELKCSSARKVLENCSSCHIYIYSMACVHVCVHIYTIYMLYKCVQAASLTVSHKFRRPKLTRYGNL